MDMEDIIVTPESADVRGSAPVINTKELLLEMRSDLKSVLRTTDILASQRLDERLSNCEDWQKKADGRMDTLVRGVPFLASVIGLLSGFIAIIGANLIGGL